MEVVSEFYSLIEQYSQYRMFIERAEKQKGSYPSQVIQKVVLEYQLKADMEADRIRPVVQKLLAAVSSIDAEIEASALSENDKEKLQEYDLLRSIGAISDEDYQVMHNELMQSRDTSKTDSLKNSRKSVTDALSHWSKLSGEDLAVPQQVSPPVEQPKLEKAPQQKPEPVVEATPAPKVTPAETSEPETPVAKANPTNEEIPSFANEISDFSELGDELDPDDLGVDMVVSNDPPPAIIEIDDSDPLEDASEMQNSEPVYDTIGVNDLDNVDDLGDHLDFNLSNEDDFSLDNQPPIADEYSIDDMEFDSIEAMEGPNFDTGTNSSSVDARSAILLRDEGSPNEAMFSFTGDTYTIGRSQDNDIQIKNDSKVSRHHCKLSKKSGHFYIEDQHSSNGTLVNGELISERRLYGGEEIKIGETVFRFSLQ